MHQHHAFPLNHTWHHHQPSHYSHTSCQVKSSHVVLLAKFLPKISFSFKLNDDNDTDTNISSNFNRYIQNNALKIKRMNEWPQFNIKNWRAANNSNSNDRQYHIPSITLSSYSFRFYTLNTELGERKVIPSREVTQHNSY